jgi:AcrR family transcriptional regulator
MTDLNGLHTRADDEGDMSDSALTSGQQDDLPDGRERLLRAAVKHLEAHSAAQLRVTAIAEEAGVAIGLIRHHFGSRDGLVAAAQQRRIEGATREDIRRIRPLLAASDAETLWSGLQQVTRATVERTRGTVRLSRFASVATAHGRPEVREAISTTFGDLLDEMSTMIDEAQQRGLLASDVSSRAAATFIQSYALGLLIHDLDPDPVDDEELVGVIMAALRAVLPPA